MRYKAAPKLAATTANQKIFLATLWALARWANPWMVEEVKNSRKASIFKETFSGSLHILLEIFQLTLKNTNPQKNLSIVVFCDPNQALEYEYLNSICIGESHNEVFHKKRGLLVYEICFHYTTC